MSRSAETSKTATVFTGLCHPHPRALSVGRIYPGLTPRALCCRPLRRLRSGHVSSSLRWRRFGIFDIFVPKRDKCNSVGSIPTTRAVLNISSLSGTYLCSPVMRPFQGRRRYRNLFVGFHPTLFHASLSGTWQLKEQKGRQARTAIVGPSKSLRRFRQMAETQALARVFFLRRR